MSASAPKILRAFRFGLLEMALMLLGMLFIRREIWQLHAMSFDVTSWQEGLIIPLAMLDGAITGGFSSPTRDVQNAPAYKGLLRWGTPLFFFLYVGCAALCERINFGVFPIAAGFVVRTIGIIMVVGGMALRLWAQRSAPIDLNPEKPLDTGFPTGPHKVLRHPDAAGKLLSLLGLPFVFNAWVPVFALPGIVILLKWYISDQEAFRISQLGEPYLEYRKKTWNLIPYLY
jgi:protein-S-isoprenylcysteine O-methyltransferase Ste14